MGLPETVVQFVNSPGETSFKILNEAAILISSLRNNFDLKLIFATNNQHKVDEVRSLISDEFQLLTLSEAGIDVDIPEPHDTLEANATEKSLTICRMTGINCF